MTPLASRSTRLRFTTGAEVREKGKYRKLQVEVRPEYLIVRASGLHSQYTVPFDAVWSLAVKIAVAAERAAKKSKKEVK